MCNRDSAYDVDIYADEKIAKRGEPTNQDKHHKRS